MVRLSQRDLRILIEFLREGYAIQDLEGFREHVVSGLRRLVPCDIAGYAEMRLKGGPSFYRFWPCHSSNPARDRTWEHFKHEHPVLLHCLQTGDGSARKISDFLSLQQFHRLGLYNEVYRPMGVEDNLVALPLVSPQIILGVSVHRNRRTFTKRDHQLLDLLRPHVLPIYEHVKAVEELRHDLRVVSDTMEQLGRSMVLLSEAGTVRTSTPTALQCLGRYFGESRSKATLPDALRRWVEHIGASVGEPGKCEPLVVERDGRRLRIRFLPDPSDSYRSVLLLEEERTIQSGDALKSLGLSTREAEVLGWLAEGKTNPEIGTILGVSPRTIDKHCERIFRRLGVESRTAAVRMALSLKT